MPARRSLRRGDRQPRPGAVRKGGSRRARALRFASPLGAAGVFGDGGYSGNIMQGGAVLRPRSYLLDGVTPLSACIVVTGAATVAPDAATGAAAFACRNLVIVGASASLCAATNCKGLLGFVVGRIAVRDGGRARMDALGKAGAFGDLPLSALVPRRVRGRVVAAKLKAYVVRGVGAAGAPGGNNAGVNAPHRGYAGAAAGAMQTGGGGSGAYGNAHAGNGGCGGPCSGGAGSGGAMWYVATDNAGRFGGPGSSGKSQYSGYSAGGGAGDHPGSGDLGGHPGEGPGGGLLALFTPILDIASGCVCSADGAKGGAGSYSGGSAGGGCVIIVTRPGGCRNSGTIRASGGASVGGGGAGGLGSVNVFTI